MNAQRIPSIELSAADETTKRNFEKLTARIGRVPNMLRAMAQSPAALEGWMSLLEALAKGLLSKKLAAELALALAGINHCQYCASSHTVLSKFAGLNDAQIVNALEGKGLRELIECPIQAINRGIRIVPDDLKGIRRAIPTSIRSLSRRRTLNDNRNPGARERSWL